MFYFSSFVLYFLNDKEVPTQALNEYLANLYQNELFLEDKILGNSKFDENGQLILKGSKIPLSLFFRVKSRF
jgi:hypothetical protein